MILEEISWKVIKTNGTLKVFLYQKIKNSSCGCLFFTIINLLT